MDWLYPLKAPPPFREFIDHLYILPGNGELLKDVSKWQKVRGETPPPLTPPTLQLSRDHISTTIRDLRFDNQPLFTDEIVSWKGMTCNNLMNLRLSLPILLAFMGWLRLLVVPSEESRERETPPSLWPRPFPICHAPSFTSTRLSRKRKFWQSDKRCEMRSAFFIYTNS